MTVLLDPGDLVRDKLSRKLCDAIITWMPRLTVFSRRIGDRLWLVDGTMDANAKATVSRRTYNGDGETECQLRGGCELRKNHREAYGLTDSQDAPTYGANTFPSGHDPCATPASVDWKVEETDRGSTMDPGRAEAVDWWAHWGVHALERHGVQL